MNGQQFKKLFLICAFSLSAHVFQMRSKMNQPQKTLYFLFYTKSIDVFIIRQPGNCELFSKVIHVCMHINKRANFEQNKFLKCE